MIVGNSATPGNTPSKGNDDKDAAPNNDIGTESKIANTAAIDSSNVHISSPTNTSPNDANPKSLADYEKSVTDKENAMINTFSNLIDNNLLPTQQNQQQQQTQQLIHHQIQENNLHSNMKTNGKLLDFDPLSVDDHHQNDIIKAPISNGNGHTLINNLDNKM